MPGSVMVIGIGNEFHADDAAGLEVARRLREEPGIAVKVPATSASTESFAGSLRA